MAAGVLLITGSGRGIGAATAILGAQAGYDICINYTADAESAAAVVALCRDHGVRAEAFKADIAQEHDVKSLFLRCDDALGPVTHLVNNAAILGARSRLDGVSAGILQRVMNVNIVGAMLCAKEAVLRMSTNHGGKGGSIVNISSIAAVLGSPGEYVHYAASKAAMDAFTIGLSKEVGTEGIRVNSVQAGTVETSMHARDGNPDRPAMVAATAPLRRTGLPEDIGEAVLWLLSEKASYTTGAVLRVAGGL